MFWVLKRTVSLRRFLLSTINICFRWEIRKLFFWYALLTKGLFRSCIKHMFKANCWPILDNGHPMILWLRWGKNGDGGGEGGSNLWESSLVCFILISFNLPLFLLLCSSDFPLYVLLEWFVLFFPVNVINLSPVPKWTEERTKQSVNQVTKHRYAYRQTGCLVNPKQNY